MEIERPTHTQYVSSRAPVWGASVNGWLDRAPDDVSSRAPVWGASLFVCNHGWGSFLFQVVPPCGGHRMSVGCPPDVRRFQVVPPCGGHQAIIVYINPPDCFKSCPRVGGIT